MKSNKNNLSPLFTMHFFAYDLISHINLFNIWFIILGHYFFLKNFPLFRPILYYITMTKNKNNMFTNSTKPKWRIWNCDNFHSFNATDLKLASIDQKCWENFEIYQIYIKKNMTRAVLPLKAFYIYIWFML